MSRQNKYNVGDLETAKQDKKKHVNKDVKYSKVFQVSILRCILLLHNSPYYSSHARFGNNFCSAEHLSAKSVQVRLL